MQPAVLDRSAFDSLFSGPSHWPSVSDWDRAARDTAEHLIEHPKTEMLMVLVPNGTFLTTNGNAPVEVDLPAYYMTVHPVSNAQYALFSSQTKHRPPSNRLWQLSEKMNHPVTNINWEEASAYCQWAGLRLPVELEWEKAARGLDGRAYPWGEEWDPNRCRNSGNKGDERTASVWRYGQGGSPFGGLQFSGNVWEWCADWHHNDTSSSRRYRVVRGGSWVDNYPNSFSAYCRNGRLPDHRFGLPNGRYQDVGFRCVRGLSTPS